MPYLTIAQLKGEISLKSNQFDRIHPVQPIECIKSPKIGEGEEVTVKLQYSEQRQSLLFHILLTLFLHDILQNISHEGTQKIKISDNLHNLHGT